MQNHQKVLSENNCILGIVPGSSNLEYHDEKGCIYRYLVLLPEGVSRSEMLDKDIVGVEYVDTQEELDTRINIW